jgi:hypothetical protein
MLRRASAAIGITMLCAITPAGAIAQSGPNDTPYVASRLIGRWRAVMNTTLEDSRTFASEGVADLMETFVSPGAVRAAQDKLKEEQLKAIDAVVRRFALEVVRSSERRDDGSRIAEESAVETAEKATCPVYPFCAK